MDQRSDSFATLVRSAFEGDLEAWRARWGDDAGSALGMLFRFPGVRATLLHRIAHWGQRRGVRGLPMLLMQLNVWLHGIEIMPHVPVGPGLYMAHTVGSIINAQSIGSNVELQGGVTIGMRNEHRFPVIEDDALIGTGARILGEVHVGRGARIGANAVVLEDVEAGRTAVGVPARMVALREPAALAN
jgi:serine O-acetyltransferase